MKLTAQVKLLPTPEQAEWLKATLERANAACNWISRQAWEQHTFGQVALHHLTYYAAREQFKLGAQMIVRCIAKVVQAYQPDHETIRTFKLHGAIAFDRRLLNWRIPDQTVSIWTPVGRQTIPFAAGERQLELLKYQKGESDLLYRKGMFLLTATCEVPDDPPEGVVDFLGADFGVQNIAYDSDNQRYSAKQLLNVRHRYRRLRRKLQRKGTPSAKRKLKRLSGKERRFANAVNHCISKQLVQKAKGTQRGIGLENLTHIRQRITACRHKRAELHSWSFADLGAKIAYKAQRYGVPIEYVDPRNTSRRCSVCGHVDKASRKTQSQFLCTTCGHASHADYNAALNIRLRAKVQWAGRSVNPPNVTSMDDSVTSSPALAGSS
jgi:IS605 OrfB family transposase